MRNLQQITIIKNIAYIDGDLEKMDDFEVPLGNRPPWARPWHITGISAFFAVFLNSALKML